MKIELLEKVSDDRLSRGWVRKARVNGVEYWVSISPGKRVRIAFKPRGSGAYGYHWVGRVGRVGGSEIWSCQDVGKSAGCKRLLTFALEHDFMKAAFGDRYAPALVRARPPV